MSQPLRVLVLEDNSIDAELAVNELLANKFIVESRRVTTESAFCRELAEFDPNVVLADYALTAYDGISALRHVLRVRPQTPFLFVSCTLGEDQAIETLKLGATDYVSKDRLGRLGLAVERALREATEHRSRLTAEQRLQRRLAYETATAESLRLVTANGLIGKTLRQILKILGSTVGAAQAHLIALHNLDTLGELAEECSVAINLLDEVAIIKHSERKIRAQLRHFWQTRLTLEVIARLAKNEPVRLYSSDFSAAPTGFRNNNYSSHLILPVHRHNTLWGAIILDYDRPTESWDDEDVRWVSGVASMMGVMLDRQQAVREMSLQAAALNAAGNAIVITNRQGVIQWVNPAWSRLTGHSLSESIGQNPRMLRSGHHSTGFYKHLWKTILAGETWESEMINLRKDGGEYHEHNTITPVRDESGDITHFIAIKEDITKRKQMEETVYEGEQRLLVILQAAQMGIFDWDIASGSIVWSQTHYELFGYPTEHLFPIKFSHFIDRLHPDDRQSVIHSFALNRHSSKGYSREFRIVLPNQAIRWIDSRGEFKFDSAGTAIRLLGTAQDITERKMAERQAVIHARLMEFRSVVSAAMSQGAELCETLQQCARAMIDFLDIAYARVWTIEDGADELCLVASAGQYVYLDILTTKLPLAFCEIGNLAKVGNPIVIDPIESDSKMQNPEWAQREGLKCFAGIPLMIERRCVGVLSLYSRRSFERDELDSLYAVAEVIAQNIDRVQKRVALAKLNQELERRIEERTARLVESERFNRATLDALSSHIVVLDAEGTIVTANRAWKDFAKANKAQWQAVSEGANYLLECDRAGFEGVRDAKLVGAALRRLFAGEIEFWSHEYPCHAPDTQRWFHCLVTRFLLNGAVHALIAHEDVTPMKRTEEALRQASREADQASRAKSEFLAAMSHELRTPLNGVLGMNTLLQNTDLSEKQRELVETSSESGKHLLQLINDILDISKIEAGKMELDERPCDLKSFIRGVVTAMAGPIRAKGLKISCDLSPDVSSTVTCDDQRLRQILVNLIGNATKFTSQGGITVSAHCVEANDTHMRFRVSVSDTGKGIPEIRLSRLFQKFSQVDSSTTRQFGGSGLGLSICKRLVELMGGTIGVESRVGVGSRFWFEFPTQLLNKNSDRQTTTPFSAGLRVICVQSNDETWGDISGWLAGWSCNTTTFSSLQRAEVAMTEVANDGSTDTVVLIQHQLIDEDGMDTINRVSKLRHLRIFVITDPDTPHLEKNWVDHGACGVLRHPLVASDLFDAIVGVVANQGLAIRPIFGCMESPAANQPMTPGMSLIKGHILVAEDNRVNQLFITELLKLFGCTFDLATNGEEAVAAVVHQQYSLVLMDCRMPEMDGFTASEEIRKWESTQSDGKRIPIVALTASALKGDRQRCLDAGMDDYVTKPIEPDILYAVLNHFLNE